ncbi:MAG: hypothetical protein QW434_09810 [Pyrobaculum sp.]
MKRRLPSHVSANAQFQIPFKRRLINPGPIAVIGINRLMAMPVSSLPAAIRGFLALLTGP